MNCTQDSPPSERLLNSNRPGIYTKKALVGAGSLLSPRTSTLPLQSTVAEFLGLAEYTQTSSGSIGSAIHKPSHKFFTRITMDRDRRLERFAWLIKVHQAVSVLTSVFTSREQPKYTFPSKPADNLRRAFYILYTLIEEQMREDYYIQVPNVRAGSLITWREVRFEQGHYANEYDPHLHDTPLEDENQETFREVSPIEPSPKVSKRLRDSRYDLLSFLKIILYTAQDENLSVQDTVQLLWTRFHRLLSTNLFLKVWFLGELSELLLFVSEADHLAFAQKLHLDQTAMFRWVQAPFPYRVEHPDFRRTDQHVALLFNEMWGQDPMYMRLDLGRENLRFVEHFRTFLEEIGERIAHHGYLEKCLNIHTWYKGFASRHELYEEECPICFKDYKVMNEGNMDTLIGSDLWKIWKHELAVVLPCKHIICSACLKSWSQADAGNNGKCPSCRKRLAPPNPHDEDLTLIQNQVNNLYLDKEKLPVKFAKSILALLDKYLDKLPTIVHNLEDAAAVTGILLSDWRVNMETPVTRETALSIAYPGSAEDMYGDWEVPVMLANIRSLQLAGARLRAFLHGDQDRLNTIFTQQTRTMIALSIMSYREEIETLIMEHEAELEEEREQELLASGTDEDA